MTTVLPLPVTMALRYSSALPVFQETRRCLGQARIAAIAPKVHALADAVDELVLLNPVLFPFREGHLLSLFPWLWNGDKVLADAAALVSIVSDAFLGETKVPRGFCTLCGLIQDGILDDDLQRCVLLPSLDKKTACAPGA